MMTALIAYVLGAVIGVLIGQALGIDQLAVPLICDMAPWLLPPGVCS